jgi:hypothetical protein
LIRKTITWVDVAAGKLPHLEPGDTVFHREDVLVTVDDHGAYGHVRVRVTWDGVWSIDREPTNQHGVLGLGVVVLETILEKGNLTSTLNLRDPKSREREESRRTRTERQ